MLKIKTLWIIKCVGFIILGACSNPQIQVLQPELEKIYTQRGKNIGGVVVFNHHGPKRLVESRRNKALSRIRLICDPKGHQITKEESVKPSHRVEKYKDQPELLGGRTITFIDFDCADSSKEK